MALAAALYGQHSATVQRNLAQRHQREAETTLARSDFNQAIQLDGRELVFTAFRLYRKTLGGREEVSLQTPGDERVFARHWSTDGKWVLLVNARRKTFYQLSLDGERKPVAVCRLQCSRRSSRKTCLAFHQMAAGLPNNSLETGRWEVYIAAFPSFGENRQISKTGVASRLGAGTAKSFST